MKVPNANEVLTENSYGFFELAYRKFHDHNTAQNNGKYIEVRINGNFLILDNDTENREYILNLVDALDNFLQIPQVVRIQYSDVM